MRDLIWHILTPNPNKRPSMEEIMGILNDWERIDRINMNSDARKIKEAYLRKHQGVTRKGVSAVPKVGDLSSEDIVRLQAKIRREKDIKKNTKLVPFHQDYKSKMENELFQKSYQNTRSSVQKVKKVHRKQEFNPNFTPSDHIKEVKQPVKKSFWDDFGPSENHNKTQLKNKPKILKDKK